MSRKYTAWATNQLSMNPDLSAMMRLATVGGNEQDQRKCNHFNTFYHLNII